MHIKTPLLYSDPLSRSMPGDVYLKMEALQPSGSFKIRGIGNFCREKKKEGVKEFISSSGGNAGLAASYAARKLSLPIRVIVPKTTPQMMIDKIKGEGADVVQLGDDWQEADAHARSLCASSERCYVSPFDDQLIWDGHATMIHEVAQEEIKPDCVVVSVGGGGLFCGVIQGMHDVGWEKVPVYAVETEGAASFAASIRAGELVELERIDTVAKSLGARKVTQQALKWSKRHPVHSAVVSDKEAVGAVANFASDHRILVEPACGAALSVCTPKNTTLKDYKTILVIVCGGAAVSPELLTAWSKKYLY